jgi:hypothetical protein
MTATSDWAASYAEALLSPLGDRWLHVQGVTRQAQRVVPILPTDDRDVLVAAAYLHDLGYAPAWSRPICMRSTAPATFARSATSALPAWSPTTPVPARKLGSVGSRPSWPNSRTRPRPRRWR